MSRLLQSTFFTLILGATTLGLTGCPVPESKTGLSYAANAERDYNKALDEFKAHNWLQAQALFREVKRKYAYSRYAPLAELRIADADFEQDKLGEAIRGYKQFVHDHRSLTAEVGYARSRIAEAQYNQISDSFLLPASEERDQVATLESYRELKSFLQDYPEAKESPRICDLLEKVTIKLVGHELSVGRFYLAKNNFEATVGRVQYAIRNFGGELACRHTTPDPLQKGEPSELRTEFGLIPEALLLLGETYLKMRKWTEAREAFNTLKKRYPESALVLQADNFLEFMKARGV
ncbi:outer membrane protein assembly factor BamD [Pendulispora brunnea]|uniref:Outer membrane protein assembly factor BamD n=1 Tax=Pendulispora brunnea TaxID=2905690 RepID=A0ABZ2KQB9_9BACT